MRILLVILLAGAVAAELAAPSFVEARIEQRVEENLRGRAVVAADVRSFPLVTRALATGRVSELEISLEEVSGQELSFAHVGLVLRGVQLDRPSLLQGKLEVQGLEQGEAVAVVDLQALGDIIGRPVDDSVVERIRVLQGRIELSVAGVSASVAVPLDILPCTPDGQVEGDSLVLRCAFTQVPDLLLEIVNSATMRGRA